MRRTRSIASSECPPRAKKLSASPTRGTPSSSAHSAATARSRSVLGSREPAPGSGPAGTASAARSTFPAAVLGSGESCTRITEGTMKGGNRPARCARTASESTVDETATCAARTSPLTTTAASATPGWAASAVSTSSSSTR